MKGVREISRIIAGKEMAFKFFPDKSRNEAFADMRKMTKIIGYLETDFGEECCSIAALKEILDYGCCYAAQSKKKKKGDKKMETILKAKDKPIVDEMVEFLKTLNIEEQKQVGFMIRGLKMGIALKENNEPKSA